MVQKQRLLYNQGVICMNNTHMSYRCRQARISTSRKITQLCTSTRANEQLKNFSISFNITFKQTDFS